MTIEGDDLLRIVNREMTMGEALYANKLRVNGDVTPDIVGCANELAGLELLHAIAFKNVAPTPNAEEQALVSRDADSMLARRASEAAAIELPKASATAGR